MNNEKHQEIGLNINQAAEKLNVSVRTVRRRIKDGSLKAIKVGGRFGEEYRIVLDKPIDATVVADELLEEADNSHPNPPEVTELLKVIRDLSQQNIDLARRVGAAEAKVQMLSEKMQFLEAPKTKASKRGFWSRIFGN
ncbi:MAG: helix-turn-helix domain-containing protein [Chloroflexi bacterium]|nr:helix-turn-helix domain-containing protein [Chloroflexota bacterium]